jgi:hypothetical protein
MDLEAFVSQTLTQIIKGVKAAQQEAAQHGAQVVPLRVSWANDQLQLVGFDHIVTPVEFDVAVEVREGSSKETGAKISAHIAVASFGIGTDRGNQTGTSSNTRVKFKVFIKPPTQTS